MFQLFFTQHQQNTKSSFQKSDTPLHLFVFLAKGKEDVFFNLSYHSETEMRIDHANFNSDVF